MIEKIDHGSNLTKSLTYNIACNIIAMQVTVAKYVMNLPSWI